MKITSLSKPLIITIFTLALLSYGFIVVNAAYPLTQWEPGETLDPTCAPGDANCSVATAWDMDLTNGLIFNDTDQVAIGTDFTGFGGGIMNPDVHINTQDGLLVTNDLGTSAQGMLVGDISAAFFGQLGTEGIAMYSIDDVLAPTQYSIFTLDLNSGMSAITTGATLNLWPQDNLSAVDQYFNLAAEALTAPNNFAGFEAQEDIDGLKAKMYYATPLTNISVIEVGPTNIMISANDHEQQTFFDQNGIEFFDQTVSKFSVAVTGEIFSDTLSGAATTLETDANGHIIRTPSDEKLKTNIETMTGNLDRVLALNPVAYHWKDTARFGEQRQMGFIAQELEMVVPEVVRSGGEYKSVNYQILTALLAGAVQEISAKIDILEQQTISAGGFSLASLRNTVQDFLGDVGNGIQDIFAKRVTTKELCIEDLCFDRQEAEMLKQLISDGVIVENVQEEIAEEEIVIPEVVEQDQIVQEPEPIEQTQEAELEPETPELPQEEITE
jgi:hypothetical protein